MANVYKIGRLVQFGVAKETTRGTSPASVTYWPAYDGELVLDEQRKLVVDQSTYGIIEDSVGEQIVMTSSEGTLKGPVTQTSFGLFLLSIFGTQSAALVGGESTVYANTFTVAESAQHQSLSFYIHDANVQDYSYANGMVSKLEIDYELEKFVSFSATLMAQKGATHSAYSPSVTQENRFAAPYGTMNIAPQLAGLVNVVAATGTAATTTAVTALSVSTDLITVGMYVNGPNITPGTTVAAIVSNSALTLSAASTGNASNLWFSTLQGTATGTSTTAITSLSFSTAQLQVGMPVYGTNVPAGATVAAIVSSTAFTLSVSTTGALTNGLSFGGLTVPIKSMKITIDAAVEPFMGSGNAAPVDFFNKEFKVTGSIEAIYRNESDFKTAFLAGNASALLLNLVNTAVTLGTAANPSLTFTMNQVYFEKLKIKRSQKDLVYATMDFKATYALGATQMINAVLTNLINGY